MSFFINKLWRIFLCFSMFIFLPSMVLGKQNQEPQVEFIGEVIKTSELPDPSTAAYPDCLTFLKFKVIKVTRGNLDTSEILVAMWGFKQYKLSEPGRFRIGDKVKLQIIPYKNFEHELSGIMRVDDTQDYDSELYWAPTWELQNKQITEIPQNLNSPITQSRKSNSDVVGKIIKIINAHNGDVIGSPYTKMTFNHYHYLTNDNFWEPALKKNSVREIGILESIIGFSEHLKSKGIQLVVVFPPSPVAIYPEIATNVDYNFDRDGRIDVTFVNFKNLLQKNDIFCVDLLPELISNKWFKGPDNEIYPLYKQYDMHWNDIGASLAGKVVARAIKEAPWFQEMLRNYPPHPAAYKENISIGSRENKSEEHPEWIFSPTKHPLRQVIPDSKSGFIMKSSGPTAPVWILGDSFAAYPAFYQSISAGLGLPYNVVASGFGSATPVREEFARVKDTSDIKIVIWEMAFPVLRYKNVWKNVIFDRSMTCDLPSKLTTSLNYSTLFKNDVVNFLGMARESISLPQLKNMDGMALPTNVIWKEVKLGAKPILTTAIGLDVNNSKRSEGIRFQVIVNGKVVASQTLEHHASSKIRDSWRQTWDIDLSAYAKKTIELQLAVEPVSSWDGEQVYWGNPIITDCAL